MKHVTMAMKARTVKTKLTGLFLDMKISNAMHMPSSDSYSRIGQMWVGSPLNGIRISSTILPQSETYSSLMNITLNPNSSLLLQRMFKTDFRGR